MHTKTRRKKATLLVLASIFMPPSSFPTPHLLSKENTAEVSECQRPRICFTFPKCHGIWAACTNEKRRGVEAGRERTRVKHGWWQGLFSTWRLIAVFMPLAVGPLINERSRPLHTITHSPLGGCTLGWDVARVGWSSGWRFSLSVILSRVPENPQPQKKNSLLVSCANKH